MSLFVGKLRTRPCMVIKPTNIPFLSTTGNLLIFLLFIMDEALDAEMPFEIVISGWLMMPLQGNPKGRMFR